MKRISMTLRRFWRDESGASAGKIAIIAAAVGVGIVGAGAFINLATADVMGPPCLNFTVEGC